MWHDSRLGKCKVAALPIWAYNNNCMRKRKHLLGVAGRAFNGVLAVAALPPVGCMDGADCRYRLLDIT